MSVQIRKRPVRSIRVSDGIASLVTGSGKLARVDLQEVAVTVEGGGTTSSATTQSPPLVAQQQQQQQQQKLQQSPKPQFRNIRKVPRFFWERGNSQRVRVDPTEDGLDVDDDDDGGSLESSDEGEESLGGDGGGGGKHGVEEEGATATLLCVLGPYQMVENVTSDSNVGAPLPFDVVAGVGEPVFEVQGEEEKVARDPQVILKTRADDDERSGVVGSNDDEQKPPTIIGFDTHSRTRTLLREIVISDDRIVQKVLSSSSSSSSSSLPQPTGAPAVQAPVLQTKDDVSSRPNEPVPSTSSPLANESSRNLNQASDALNRNPHATDGVAQSNANVEDRGAELPRQRKSETFTPPSRRQQTITLLEELVRGDEDAIRSALTMRIPKIDASRVSQPAVSSREEIPERVQQRPEPTATPSIRQRTATLLGELTKGDNVAIENALRSMSEGVAQNVPLPTTPIRDRNPPSRMSRIVRESSDSSNPDEMDQEARTQSINRSVQSGVSNNSQDLPDQSRTVPGGAMRFNSLPETQEHMVVEESKSTVSKPVPPPLPARRPTHFIRESQPSQAVGQEPSMLPPNMPSAKPTTPWLQSTRAPPPPAVPRRPQYIPPFDRSQPPQSMHVSEEQHVPIQTPHQAPLQFVQMSSDGQSSESRMEWETRNRPPERTQDGRRANPTNATKQQQQQPPNAECTQHLAEIAKLWSENERLRKECFNYLEQIGNYARTAQPGQPVRDSTQHGADITRLWNENRKLREDCEKYLEERKKNARTLQEVLAEVEDGAYGSRGGGGVRMRMDMEAASAGNSLLGVLSEMRNRLRERENELVNLRASHSTIAGQNALLEAQAKTLRDEVRTLSTLHRTTATEAANSKAECEAFRRECDQLRTALRDVHKREEERDVKRRKGVEKALQEAFEKVAQMFSVLQDENEHTRSDIHDLAGRAARREHAIVRFMSMTSVRGREREELMRFLRSDGDEEEGSRSGGSGGGGSVFGPPRTSTSQDSKECQPRVGSDSNDDTFIGKFSDMGLNRTNIIYCSSCSGSDSVTEKVQAALQNHPFVLAKLCNYHFSHDPNMSQREFVMQYPSAGYHYVIYKR